MWSLSCLLEINNTTLSTSCIRNFEVYERERANNLVSELLQIDLESFNHFSFNKPDTFIFRDLYKDIIPNPNPLPHDQDVECVDLTAEVSGGFLLCLKLFSLIYELEFIQLFITQFFFPSRMVMKILKNMRLIVSWRMEN
jgi:hypothetical protein